MKRRFADGGETDPDLEAANASEDPIAYMNKAKRWTETEEAPTKRKVVTKEELAKSGLSLRDYMNKQQGLTRRRTPYSGTGGSGGGRGPTAEELQTRNQSYETPYDRRNRENQSAGITPSALMERAKSAPVRRQGTALADLSSRMTSPKTLLPVQKYAKGGSIDGCAQRGKTKGRYL